MFGSTAMRLISIIWTTYNKMWQADFGILPLEFSFIDYSPSLQSSALFFHADVLGNIHILLGQSPLPLNQWPAGMRRRRFYLNFIYSLIILRLLNGISPPPASLAHSPPSSKTSSTHSALLWILPLPCLPLPKYFPRLAASQVWIKACWMSEPLFWVTQSLIQEIFFGGLFTVSWSWKIQERGSGEDIVIPICKGAIAGMGPRWATFWQRSRVVFRNMAVGSWIAKREPYLITWLSTQGGKETHTEVGERAIREGLHWPRRRGQQVQGFGGWRKGAAQLEGSWTWSLIGESTHLYLHSFNCVFQPHAWSSGEVCKNKRRERENIIRNRRQRHSGLAGWRGGKGRVIFYLCFNNYVLMP